MRNSLFIIITAVMLFAACSDKGTRVKGELPADAITGSWSTGGTFYAGSQITGTTTFIFNTDNTFESIEKAKGMPVIKESGSYRINGDTLEMKYLKGKRRSPDVVAYDERNGGEKDLIKPAHAENSGITKWNFKITGNRLVLASSYGYSGPNELIKE